MKVLIIEDEPLSRAKLQSMLTALDKEIVVVGTTASVRESINWLRHNDAPDVAFVDIQLSDDHSFEIFRKFQASFPVVFTTAFDQFLLESFEFNSIDYLLKPITEEKLLRSLQKIKNLEKHFSSVNIEKLISGQQLKSSDRIIVKKGTDFLALVTGDIAYFFTEHRIVFVKDRNGRQYITDKTLTELEEALDPRQFFRINRKYIAHIDAIEKFKPDNGRIKVMLKPETAEEIHVSKETAPEFRNWIKREG